MPELSLFCWQNHHKICIFIKAPSNLKRSYSRPSFNEFFTIFFVKPPNTYTYIGVGKGVTRWGTGGTCPPQLFGRGGHSMFCPPQLLNIIYVLHHQNSAIPLKFEHLNFCVPCKGGDAPKFWPFYAFLLEMSPPTSGTLLRPCNDGQSFAITVSVLFIWLNGKNLAKIVHFTHSFDK